MIDPLSAGRLLLTGTSALRKIVLARQTHADKIAAAVESAGVHTNRTELARFLAEEETYWCLVYGLNGESRLTDLTAEWLAEDDPALQPEDVRERAAAIARVATDRFLPSLDEGERANVIDFRNNVRHEQVMAAARSDLDVAGLPPATGEALVRAHDLDDGAAKRLTELLSADDAVTTRAYDSIQFVAHLDPGPAVRHLGLAMYEFVASHGFVEQQAEVARVLAEHGTPDAPGVCCRAAFTQRSETAADELLALAEELAPESRTPAVVRAYRAEDSQALMSLVPPDTTNVVEALALASAHIRQREYAAAITVLESAAKANPNSTALPVTAAKIRLLEVGTDAPEGLRRLNEPRSVVERRKIETALDQALEVDRRRLAYGGRSADALATAMKAAVRLHRTPEALDYARADDGSLRPEVEDPEVADVLAAVAALTVNHDLIDEVLDRVSEDHEKQLLLGLYFVLSGNAKDTAVQAFRRAVETCPDGELIRPLMSLAHEGVDLPEGALERLRAWSPDDALMVEAAHHLANDRHQEALGTIGRVSAEFATIPHVVLTRGHALVGLGRIDDAVEMLEQIAVRNSDGTFVVAAVDALGEAGRYDEAQVLCDRHVLGFADFSNALLRRRAMDLAGIRRDWKALERHASDALALGQVDSDAGRWAQIGALVSQGKTEDAYRILTSAPLEPPEERFAQLAVQLHANHGTNADDLRALLDIADAHKDSESVLAGAIAAILTMNSGAPMPHSALARFRRHLEHFDDRFPESELLVKVQVSSDLHELHDFLRQQQQPSEALRPWLLAAQAGNVPIGVICTVVDRPYLPAVITPLVGFRCAATLDLANADAERAVASDAMGGAVVVDASVIALLMTTDGLDPATVLANYKLLVTGDTLRDAKAAQALLARRSTATVGWDDHADQPYLHEITEEEADRRAGLADGIVEFLVGNCEVVEVEGEPERPPSFSAIQLAASREVPLLADDVALRITARNDGVPAFGTVAVLEQAGLDAELVRALRENYVADLPFDLPRLLDIAHEVDDWSPGAAAVPLLRSTSWANPAEPFALLRECLAVTTPDQKWKAAGWVRAAAFGHGLSMLQVPADKSCGHVLSIAVAQNGAGGADAVPYLLAGARAAATELGGDDPLPFAAAVLAKEFIEDDPVTAAQNFAAVFSACEDVDRQAAGYVFLTVEPDAD